MTWNKNSIPGSEDFLVAAEKKSKTFLPELDEKENGAQNEVERSLFHQEAASKF